MTHRGKLFMMELIERLKTQPGEKYFPDEQRRFWRSESKDHLETTINLRENSKCMLEAFKKITSLL